MVRASVRPCDPCGTVGWSIVVAPLNVGGPQPSRDSEAPGIRPSPMVFKPYLVSIELASV